MSRVSIKKDQLRLLIHFRLPPDFFDISKGTDEISPSHGSATSRRSWTRSHWPVPGDWTGRGPRRGQNSSSFNYPAQLEPNWKRKLEWMGGRAFRFMTGSVKNNIETKRGSNIFRRKSQIKQFLVEMMSKFFTSVGRSCNEFWMKIQKNLVHFFGGTARKAQGVIFRSEQQMDPYWNE